MAVENAMPEWKDRIDEFTIDRKEVLHVCLLTRGGRQSCKGRCDFGRALPCWFATGYDAVCLLLERGLRRRWARPRFRAEMYIQVQYVPCRSLCIQILKGKLYIMLLSVL